MFAVRSFLDAGIRVTQASDYPPGPFEPMMALQSSVTRTDIKGTLWGPAQRVSVEQALRVGTLNGAYASYEEHVKGSIEAGKLADLVVLDRDPLQNIRNSNSVRYVMKNGRLYEGDTLNEVWPRQRPLPRMPWIHTDPTPAAGIR
jgi:predicted amidohydrolase YtcJ